MGNNIPCGCRFCTTVAADEVAIVERFGAYSYVAPPGLLCLPCPCMLMKAGTLSTRQFSSPYNLECKSKDNVFVEINIELQYCLNQLKAFDAFYKLAKVDDQIQSYVADTVRATAATRTLDEIYNDRHVIISNVRERVYPTLEAYGYLLIAVLVNEVRPATKVFAAINQIETCKRLKESTWDAAEANKMIQVKRSEAEAERKRLQGIGTSRQRLALMRGMEMNVHKFVNPDDTITEFIPRTLMECQASNIDGNNMLKEMRSKLGIMKKPRRASVIGPIDNSMEQETSSSGSKGADGCEKELDDSTPHNISRTEIATPSGVNMAVETNTNGKIVPMSKKLMKRASMDDRIFDRIEAGRDALTQDANRLRMPTDVGIVDTELLFPDNARFHRSEKRMERQILSAERQKDGEIASDINDFSAADVMELLLITNYFDTLKEMGQNDSQSTIYIANSPGIVATLRNEIRENFGRDRKNNLVAVKA